MPEATIHEDGDSGPWEHDISFSPKAGQWAAMYEVAKTKSVQFLAKGELRRGIPSRQVAHPFVNICTGSEWCAPALGHGLYCMASATQAATC